MLNNDVNEKIRSAFLSLLSEKSYSKVTFKEVASVTGMTRQNLYYYYESKENVLEDVIEEFFDRLYQTILNVEHHSDAFPDRKNNPCLFSMPRRISGTTLFLDQF